jgi:hypothetical protein
MKRPNRLLAALACLAMALAACTTRTKPTPTGADADPAAVPDLSGEYVVNGVDPQGTEYGGSLIIQPGPTAGEYDLQWIVVGSIQEGTGKVRGNQLLVEWRAVEGTTEARGTATLTITVNGELYGTRRVDGLEAEGTEAAFPNKKK